MEPVNNKTNPSENSPNVSKGGNRMRFIFHLIVALLVIGLCAWVVYCYTTRGGTGRNAKETNTFSNVCIAVEPELGQIRLPNATDPKFRAELKAKNGDTITIACHS